MLTPDVEVVHMIMVSADGKKHFILPVTQQGVVYVDREVVHLKPTNRNTFEHSIAALFKVAGNPIVARYYFANNYLGEIDIGKRELPFYATLMSVSSWYTGDEDGYRMMWYVRYSDRLPDYYNQTNLYNKVMFDTKQMLGEHGFVTEPTPLREYSPTGMMCCSINRKGYGRRAVFINTFYRDV